MKGCLVHHPNNLPSAALASPPKRPKNVQRKSVSFCGSSQAEEQEKVEVYVADDWDRTPCQITPKLSYKDILELYELKLSVPRSSSDKSGSGQPLPTLLEGVPVALLPLLSDETPTPKPPAATTSPTLSTNPSPVSSASNYIRPPYNQLSPGGKLQSPIIRSSGSAFRPPPSATRSGLRNFQFLPIYPTEDHPSHELDVSSHDQDSDHTTTSPTSTPSLTSSSGSPPSSPSACPSPLEIPPTSVMTAVDSYFDLPRLQTSPPVRQRDLSHTYKADVKNAGATSARIQYPASKKPTLKALSSPNLVPPSPFDLHGSVVQGQYLYERTQQQQVGLRHGVVGKPKDVPRRVFYTGGDDDDVDEPFFPLERNDRSYYSNKALPRNAK